VLSTAPTWKREPRSVWSGTWLKLAFWDGGAATTPADTLRRAYDVMPGIEPPPELDESGLDLAGSLHSVLVESFGERVELELFAGFLIAVGGVLLARGAPLASDAVLVAEFADATTIAAPVVPPVVETGLDEAIARALAAAHPPPTVEQTLDRIALAARDLVVDGQSEQVLVLRRIRVDARPEETGADPNRPMSSAWVAARALLAAGPPIAPTGRAVLAGALESDDWRARMAAALADHRRRAAGSTKRRVRGPSSDRSRRRPHRSSDAAAVARVAHERLASA
jgi:hypothetical protein